MLLLDEITVDLDVLGRADLLRFLQQETEERGATVIYVCVRLISPSVPTTSGDHLHARDTLTASIA